MDVGEKKMNFDNDIVKKKNFVAIELPKLED